ncbi:MAG: PEP-CTERM sorting domain-containing protein [Phycisphaerales bacterium]
MSDAFSGTLNVGAQDTVTLVQPWDFDGQAHLMGSPSGAATINGGKMSMAAGTINVESGIGSIDCEFKMNAGTLNVANGTTLRFGGLSTIENLASLNIPGGLVAGSGVTVSAQGDTTIRQTVMDLDGVASKNTVVVGGGKKLTIYTGSLDTQDAQFNGKMDVAGTLNIDLSSAQSWVLGNGGVLNLNGASLYGSTIQGDNVQVAAGGLVKGQGLFTAGLNNVAGTVSPNALVLGQEVTGTLTVGGVSSIYSQGVNGRLKIDIAGDHTSQIDHLSTNVANLGGVLDISLLNGFVPSIGDSFVFLNASSSVNGHFDSVLFPTLTNIGLGLIYGSNTVTLRAGLLGDLDGDGFVGISDLNIVLGNWNQDADAGVWIQGDPSGDGFIGIDDLNVVLGNWNTGSPPTDIQVFVPEPASLALLTIGGLVLTQRKCRNHFKGDTK